jgi:hypothetical protein
MGEEIRYEPPSRAVLEAGYEPDEVGVRGILMTAVWLVIVAIVVHLLLWVMMRAFESKEHRADPDRSPVVQSRQGPPEPRLQPLIELHDTTPAQDWELMKAQNQQTLGSYGWVDRDKGVARIPIDRAMQLVAQRGLPVRGTPTTREAK